MGTGADGELLAFKRRRTIELWHGRITYELVASSIGVRVRPVPEDAPGGGGPKVTYGRLAKAADIGTFLQAGVTGSARGGWALRAASPPRVFENELGAQDPDGFCDPVGTRAGGDLLVPCLLFL